MVEVFYLSDSCFIDADDQTVCRAGRTYRLTDIEYRILCLLIERVGQPVCAEEIISHIWTGGGTGTRENLNVQIGKIRRRIEPSPRTPKHLLSIRGVGYMLWASGTVSN